MARLFRIPVDWLEKVIEDDGSLGNFTAKSWLASEEYEALENFCYIKGIKSTNLQYLKKSFGGVRGLYASYCHFFQNDHNRKPRITRQIFYKSFLQYLSEKEKNV